MRVLITGAGGFIGRHLVESQLAQGHAVRAADVHCEALASWDGHPRLDVRQSDVSEPGTAQALLDGIDVVYHLASVHLDVTRSDAEYREVNVAGSVRLVAAARDAGVRRFVHCSSAGVFGSMRVPPAATETSPCNPTHIYEQTKLEGERAVIDFARRTGFSAVAARPSWVYGPGCPRTHKLFRVVGSGRFVMFGNGRTRRQPIYVSDIVRGLERCAEADVAPGELYLLAGREGLTIAELVHRVGEAQGIEPRVVYVPAAAGHLAGAALQLACRPFRRRPPFSPRSMDFFLKDTMYDVTKASRELAFEATVDLRAGLSVTAAHLRRTSTGAPALASTPPLAFAGEPVRHRVEKA